MMNTDFAADMAAAKGALSFGDVAWGLGLKGSSRVGWQCPACGTLEAVKERPDHKGGRCANPACNKGYDAPALVMTARGASARAALTFMERLVAEQEARAAGKGAPQLFEREENGNAG